VATDPTTELPSTGLPASAAGRPVARWVTLTAGAAPTSDAVLVRPRRIVVQLVVGVVAVLAAVGVLGALAAQRLAEREAVNDAAAMANVLAEAVIQPALTDQLLTGSTDAVRAMDSVVRDQVLGPDVVRVKLWRSDGRVLYADEPALVGRTFALSTEQREVLSRPKTQAEVSDLDRAENEFESGGRLLEVYRPVWTPSGAEVLFEIYSPYASVGDRASQLARGFAGVTLSSLLLLVVLVAPLLWHLTHRLQRAQGQREVLLERAVEASAQERRRIAATLHDGPVQELAATSFAVAGAAARAEVSEQPEVADDLNAAAASVRSSIRALRSLLVEIYPPSLATAGLAAALTDLAQSVRGPRQEVRLDVAPAETLGLIPEEERLAFRVAQECLRNAAKHAGPATVTVSVARDGDAVTLDVVDDGVGFDLDGATGRPDAGHFGLSLMTDAARDAGALLQVASAPGRGTHWRLVMTQEGRSQ
jgi:signal transduction histidine kinase